MQTNDTVTFTALSKLLMEIKTEIIIWFETRFDSLESRISNIETKQTNFELRLKELETTSSINVQVIIGEMKEREKRKRNVILYNLEKYDSPSHKI